MSLNSDEQHRFEHAQATKHWIESDTWKEVIYPQILTTLSQELPKPNQPGWEDKYRYAHALTTAARTLESIMRNIASEVDTLRTKADGNEPDFNEA